MNGHGHRDHVPSSHSSREREVREGKRRSHGNFADYYSRRRDAAEDRRVGAIAAFLEARLERGKASRMLDVGCNSGEVTLGLSRALSPAKRPNYVLGVDVDEVLVRNARAKATKLTEHGSGGGDGVVDEEETNPYLAHRAAIVATEQPRKRLTIDTPPPVVPSRAEDALEEQETEFRFCNVDWVYNDRAADQLSSQRASNIGIRKASPDNGSSSKAFPVYHITQVAQSDTAKYDVILALSLTKWIHMHTHDVGLRRFFARLTACLTPGGFLLLEPQPWKSYEQARREVSTEVRVNGRTLQLRPEDFDWLLCCELGLLGPHVLARQGQAGFSRDLLAYRKPSSDDEWEVDQARVKERIETLLRLPRFDTETRQNPDVDMAWVAREPKPTKKAA
ncbi:Bin3-domain-containing protein [Acaromyces ingoldii]|uniref:RNA methyltransferase n=1 Tax=Acaromyces ingoldii TaxID=215250 RepID=A0A316YHN2_9BASI|nr:Bin3-domain-containing protein [Acaromyces ingoldii]PWN88128.1 Bin3-domain-containing protein [Acaromyces ingoldii]